MPRHGGDGQWPEPGQWRSVEGPVVPCENGLHICTLDQLTGWLGPEVWTVEVADDAEVVTEADKIVVSRARLIERLETWNERTTRLFACDCAEHVLHLFESRYPDDARPREAIIAARRYANGEATDTELSAARAAARAADGAAAWAAAWAADGAAERTWQTARLGQYLRGEVA